MDDDDKEYDLTYDASAKFPDGTPKYVYGYEEIDGIMHVYVNGVHMPIFSDHRLIVEVEHKYWGHHYPEVSPWPGQNIPMTMNP